METAGRPGRQVAALDKRGREAAHGRVAYHTGPGGAAADDEDFRFERGHCYRPQYRSGQGLARMGTVPKTGCSRAGVFRDSPRRGQSLG